MKFMVSGNVEFEILEFRMKGLPPPASPLHRGRDGRKKVFQCSKCSESSPCVRGS